MKSDRPLRAVYNLRFIKYFALTAGVLLLLSLIGFYERYMGLYILNRQPFYLGLGHWTLAAAATLPSTVTVSLGVAAFLAFRNVSDVTGSRGFWSAAAVGTLLCIVLGTGFYFYSCCAAPACTARLSSEIYTLRQGNYPREKGGKELDYDFRDSSPSLSNQRLNDRRLDSLSAYYIALYGETSALLASLPDDLAKESFASYRLGEAGIKLPPRGTTAPNRPALENLPAATSEDNPADPTEDPITEIYRQNDLRLYSVAVDLHNTADELARYRRESLIRKLHGIAVPVIFLIFAALGYSLRHKSLRQIFAVIAALITASYLYNAISTQTASIVENNIREGTYYIRHRGR